MPYSIKCKECAKKSTSKYILTWSYSLMVVSSLAFCYFCVTFKSKLSLELINYPYAENVTLAFSMQKLRFPPELCNDSFLCCDVCHVPAACRGSPPRAPSDVCVPPPPACCTALVLRVLVAGHEKKREQWVSVGVGGADIRAVLITS